MEVQLVQLLVLVIGFSKSYLIKHLTELAFDTLGISNLWKDKKNEINKVENDLNLKNVDFSEKQNKTDNVEKEFKEHDKLAVKGMTFDYPKWSPLSYQPTNRNKYKNLSSLS